MSRFEIFSLTCCIPVPNVFVRTPVQAPEQEGDNRVRDTDIDVFRGQKLAIYVIFAVLLPTNIIGL